MKQTFVDQECGISFPTKRVENVMKRLLLPLNLLQESDEVRNDIKKIVDKYRPSPSSRSKEHKEEGNDEHEETDRTDDEGTEETPNPKVTMNETDKKRYEELKNKLSHINKQSFRISNDFAVPLAQMLQLLTEQLYTSITASYMTNQGLNDAVDVVGLSNFSEMELFNLVQNNDKIINKLNVMKNIKKEHNETLRNMKTTSNTRKEEGDHVRRRRDYNNLDVHPFSTFIKKVYDNKFPNVMLPQPLLIVNFVEKVLMDFVRNVKVSITREYKPTQLKKNSNKQTMQSQKTLYGKHIVRIINITLQMTNTSSVEADKMIENLNKVLTTYKDLKHEHSLQKPARAVPVDKQLEQMKTRLLAKEKQQAKLHENHTKCNQEIVSFRNQIKELEQMNRS